MFLVLMWKFANRIVKTCPDLLVVVQYRVRLWGYLGHVTICGHVVTGLIVSCRTKIWIKRQIRSTRDVREKTTTSCAYIWVYYIDDDMSIGGMYMCIDRWECPASHHVRTLETWNQNVIIEMSCLISHVTETSFHV